MSSTRAEAVSIHATSPELIASPVGTVAFGTGANKATSERATSKRNGRGFARFMCILVEKLGTARVRVRRPPAEPRPMPGPGS